jgi:hypothetical protein
MHPESRHARAPGGTCRSRALANSPRCCFPTRLHLRPGKRPAAPHPRRHANLRFAAPAGSIETIEEAIYRVSTNPEIWQNTPLSLASDDKALEHLAFAPAN